MHAVERELDSIYLELITQDLSVDFGGNALVIEVAQLGVVIDLQLLLASRWRVRNIELHDRSKLALQQEEKPILYQDTAAAV